MRQPLAMFLARFALLALTLGMAAHMLAGTVLDPSRPGRVVAAVLETDGGRDQVAAAATKAVPAKQRPAAQAAVRAQLDSPQVRDAIAQSASRRDGTVDVAALKGTVVDALRESDPALATRVAAAPVQDVAAPADVFTQLNRAHDLTVQARGWLWATALAAALVAVAVGRRRSVVLRRLGRGALWCVGGVVATFWVAPLLLDKYTGHGSSTGHVLATGLRASGMSLLVPVIPVALLGVVALVVAAAGSALAPLSKQKHLSRSERRELEDLRRNAKVGGGAAGREPFSAAGRPVSEQVSPAAPPWSS